MARDEQMQQIGQGYEYAKYLCETFGVADAEKYLAGMRRNAYRTGFEPYMKEVRNGKTE